MRTTLDIEEDILAALRGVAEKEGISLGKAASKLIRKALAPTGPVKVRNGVPLFQVPAVPTPVTLDLVNRLRDDDLGGAE